MNSFDKHQSSIRRVDTDKAFRKMPNVSKLIQKFEHDTVSAVEDRHIEKQGKIKSTKTKTSMSKKNLTIANLSFRDSGYGPAVGRVQNDEKRNQTNHNQSKQNTKVPFESTIRKECAPGNISGLEARFSGWDASAGQKSLACLDPKAFRYERGQYHRSLFPTPVFTASSLSSSGTTTRRTEDLVFASSEREVTHRIENDLSSRGSGYGLSVGRVQNDMQRNQTNHNQSEQNTKAPIESTIRKVCAPGNTSGLEARFSGWDASAGQKSLACLDPKAFPYKRDQYRRSLFPSPVFTVSSLSSSRTTTRRTEDLVFTSSEREVARRIGSDLSSRGSGYGLGVGRVQNDEQRNQTNHNQSEQNTKAPFESTIRKECAPGNTSGLEARFSGWDASAGQKSLACLDPKAFRYERGQYHGSPFPTPVFTASSLSSSGTTTRRTEDLVFSSSEREVAHRIENDLSSRGSGYGLGVGRVQNDKQRNQTNHNQSEQKTKAPFESTIRKECAPGNTSGLEARFSGWDASAGQKSLAYLDPKAFRYERGQYHRSLFPTPVFTASSLSSSGTTTRRTEDMVFASSEREVAHRIGSDLSSRGSGYGLSVGRVQNDEQRNQTNHNQSERNTKAPIESTIRKECASCNTSGKDALEKKIKDVEHQSVFSSTEAKKRNFRQFFETMNSPAETTQDKELKNELENVSEKMRLHLKGSLGLMDDYLDPHYVVLLGDAGTGKSTIVEKLTGQRGRSSDAKESFTRSSKSFCVPEGSLIIADTPGSNSIKAKFKHNTQIAGALNFRPVSRIFIVVRAEPRMDNVVDDVRKYADHFVELPMDVVAVLVTHMDMVGWEKRDFIPAIDDELGITTVVFSSITTRRETLLSDIIKTCTETHNLTVDNENFLRLFKIHNNHRKILQSTSNEIKKFSDKKKAFDEARKAFTGKDLVDLVFEFQAYMADEIIEAQKRMAEEHNFTFHGDSAANEAGHVANMVNQLRMVLYNIRKECLDFQSGHGVSELRKCPYCGLVWTKVEGCDGDTTCGSRPETVNDLRDSSFAVLGTFIFKWIGTKLQITKTGKKSVISTVNSTSQSAGCGKTINWAQMSTVDVPPEFSQTVKVCTSDIKILPSSASEFETYLSNEIRDATKGMSLSNKPSRY